MRQPPKKEEKKEKSPPSYGTARPIRSVPYGRRIMKTSSGRKIKGRGTIRYRSRSRSRSTTPPHWRQEQQRTKPFREFERSQKSRLSPDKWQSGWSPSEFAGKKKDEREGTNRESKDEERRHKHKKEKHKSRSKHKKGHKHKKDSKKHKKHRGGSDRESSPMDASPSKERMSTRSDSGSQSQEMNGKEGKKNSGDASDESPPPTHWKPGQKPWKLKQSDNDELERGAEDSPLSASDDELKKIIQRSTKQDTTVTYASKYSRSPSPRSEHESSSPGGSPEKEQQTWERPTRTPSPSKPSPVRQLPAKHRLNTGTPEISSQPRIPQTPSESESDSSSSDESDYADTAQKIPDVKKKPKENKERFQWQPPEEEDLEESEEQRKSRVDEEDEYLYGSGKDPEIVPPPLKYFGVDHSIKQARPPQKYPEEAVIFTKENNKELSRHPISEKPLRLPLEDRAEERVQNLVQGVKKDDSDRVKNYEEDKRSGSYARLQEDYQSSNQNDYRNDVDPQKTSHYERTDEKKIQITVRELGRTSRDENYRPSLSDNKEVKRHYNDDALHGRQKASMKEVDSFSHKEALGLASHPKSVLGDKWLSIGFSQVETRTAHEEVKSNPSWGGDQYEHERTEDAENRGQGDAKLQKESPRHVEREEVVRKSYPSASRQHSDSESHTDSDDDSSSTEYSDSSSDGGYRRSTRRKSPVRRRRRYSSSESSRSRSRSRSSRSRSRSYDRGSKRRRGGGRRGRSRSPVRSLGRRRRSRSRSRSPVRRYRRSYSRSPSRERRSNKSRDYRRSRSRSRDRYYRDRSRSRSYDRYRRRRSRSRSRSRGRR
ncbi:uncharacterized protein LOC102808957 [Saccoglossus kowalevskii]|nr:PREDICTED: serine/arginine repetitive matrix protein 2-like isoform X2 [Saccoglossus kowalevskii]